MDNGDLRLEGFKDDDERNQYLDKAREAMGLPKPEEMGDPVEELFRQSRELSRQLVTENF